MTLFDRYPAVARGISPGVLKWVPLLALVFGSLPVQAHLCGDSVKKLGPGLYQYTITADVEDEADPSDYSVIDAGNTSVVEIVSPYNFSSPNVGQWTLRTVNPGTTTLQFQWSYSPSNASGFCSVNINVVPPTNRTTAANFFYSQAALDPVNAYTGELIQPEEPDLNLGGVLPLRFIRYYASGLARASVMAEPLGPNWSHNFNARLLRAGDLADVITARGQRISFEKTGGVWQLTGMSVNPYQLLEQGTNFVFGDPRSRRIQTFDGAGRLIEIADEAGNTLTLTYAGQVLDEVTDGLGRTLTFQYAGFQTMSSVSDGTRSVLFGYSGQLLSQVTDARGKITQYNYDFINPIPALLTSKVLPRGNTPRTQQWDSLGRVTRQVAAGVGNYDFNYDGQTTWVTNPVGEVIQLVHNTNGALTSFTDATGKTLTRQYDASGLPTGATDREGRFTTRTNHPGSGLPSFIQHPDGRTVSVEYVGRTNASGIVFHHASKITYDDGTFDQYFHDVSGNVTNWTDRAGRPLSVTYNNAGQPLTASDVLGRTLFVSYNTNSTLATFGLPAGSGFETSYSYDGLNRKTSVNRPDGTTLTFQYDEQDHITQITDERNNVRTSTFDDNGYVQQTVDEAGRTNLVSYDDLDRVIGLTDPLGNTLGFGYHPSGKLSAVTNRLGHVTRYAFDSANRLVGVTNAAGFAHTYVRNEEGTLDALTDPLGDTTFVESLADGNVTRVTSPLTNISTATYNDFGCLIGLTNAEGGVMQRTLDPTDRLLHEQVGGVASAGYTHDAVGLFNGIIDGNGGLWAYPRGPLSLIASAVDPLNQTILYTNDLRGRVASMTFPGGLGSLLLSYSGLDEITQLLYSDGNDIRFTNNPVGQLTGATGISQAFDAAGRMTNCNGLTLAWDAAGQMTNLTFQPGRSLAYAYDARGLVTNISDWAGGGVSIEYDAASRPLVIRRMNGVHTTNMWNAEGMLTGIEHGALGDIALVRDANGNVAQSVRNLPVTPTLVADAKHWTVDIASQINGYSYDALGRFLSDGERMCSWDVASRLTNIVWGTNSVVCTYDALSYRLTRTFNGNQAVCVWNYGQALPTMTVVRMGGSDARYFIYTPAGDLVYSIEADTNNRWYYHYDEVGNTVFLTDDGGSILAAYAYSPFGEMLGSTGSVANPFTWQGRNGAFREGDSDLYYLRLRFHDGRTGRFVSRDPVHSMDPLRVNPYQYALNNPQRYIDPTGLDSVFDYAQFRGGNFTDGLLDSDDPSDIRVVTGAKYSLRDLRLSRFEFYPDLEINSALNAPVFSKLQWEANFGLSYTIIGDKEDKIARLERELRDIGQSLPPQGRMGVGRGWDAQDANWSLAVGAYFGGFVDDLTQPSDFADGRIGGDMEDYLDPLARLDELQAELERCRRGDPPPIDASNYQADFNWSLSGGASYSASRRLSLGLQYDF